MATMKDVARLAGVSIATVSATVNRSAFVSPELRRRVGEAIHELGYAPDGIARSLKRGRTQLIGLIVADITNAFFTELVHVIEAAIQEAGYSVLLCDTDEDFAKERDYLKILRTHRVDGVILAPTGQPGDYAAFQSLEQRLPLVLVDRVLSELNADTVTVDNVAAAFEATAHLLDLGHREIASVTGPLHLTSAQDRLRGFRTALQQRGIAAREEFIRSGAFREEEAMAAALDLLKGPNRPSAIFVANNHMMIGVMRAISQLDLNCPRDVSIVGIDDFPWANAFKPRLTLVRQPVEEIGKTAVRMLLERRKDDAERPPVHHVLKPTLVVRDSCARFQAA
ncbi:MAG TPA: LacI family DNA-binding transcriptional regulator [Dongiaceae bacterium]|jgi:LacI family transcriptional regulator|nr:LacI family DNA-binding transcriptional regulator [Dongiaceae bacterium]